MLMNTSQCWNFAGLLSYIRFVSLDRELNHTIKKCCFTNTNIGKLLDKLDQ